MTRHLSRQCSIDSLKKISRTRLTLKEKEINDYLLECTLNDEENNEETNYWTEIAKVS